MGNNKVNLFVVGAMKAGTTSFIGLLSTHPDIYVSPVKEPHYFIDDLPDNLYEPSRFFNLDNYLEKDFPGPLHISKIEKKSHYQKLFSFAKKEKYLAEGSTTYLHAEESALKIYTYNPDAKIIVLRRNPLDRSFSHYTMDLALGRIKKNFDEVLKEEIKLYKEGKLHWNSYLGMSFYNDPIERYQKLFNKILIIDLEELITKKNLVLEKVSKYLKIEFFNTPKIAHKNAGNTLRFQKLFYFLKKLGLKDYFSKIFNYNFRQWLFKKISKEKNTAIKISEWTKQEVMHIFKKESQKW